MKITKENFILAFKIKKQYLTIYNKFTKTKDIQIRILSRYINMKNKSSQMQKPHLVPDRSRSVTLSYKNGKTQLKKNLSSTSSNILTHKGTQSLYHFHRNNKSMKILSLHLKQYKQQNAEKQEKRIQPKLFEKIQTSSIDNFSKVKQSQDIVSSKDQTFNIKCQALVDNLLLNIAIFKKVYATSKKKRALISKLYGWDPIFNPIFFTKHGQSYSQQFRTNITKQSIITQLGLQKKSFASQNIYNKMRLFFAQLTNSNMHHQQSSSQQRRSKLIQSCQKLRKSLDKLNNDIQNGNIGPKGQRSIMKEIEVVKRTHIDMVNMKIRIKNKAGDIQKLARNTGIIKVNPFYLQQQRNVQHIEQFVQNVISNDK